MFNLYTSSYVFANTTQSPCPDRRVLLWKQPGPELKSFPGQHGATVSMGLRARVRHGQQWASVSKVSRKPSLSTGPVSSQGQNGASIYTGPGARICTGQGRGQCQTSLLCFSYILN
ncbi:unnamed protein product [Gadus morhua 'NCC']